MVCEVTNVIVIMCTSNFMMICLMHGLGRTHEYRYLAIGAVYMWIVLSGAKLMQQKLGKTKLRR